MANTRNLSRVERKAAKRSQRQANKALYASLTPKERKGFHKHEGSFKNYLREKLKRS